MSLHYSEDSVHLRIANVSLIDAAVPMASSFTLLPIYLGNIVNYSIQLVFTGTPTGTLGLQCSNDPGNPPSPGKLAQSAAVTNWTDITGSPQSVSSAGNHVWDVQNCGYLWTRVVYTAASGSGSLTSARFTVKGG